MPDSWIVGSKARGSVHRGTPGADGDLARCAGMLYVEVPVAPGAAAPIKYFYEEMLLATCTIEPAAGGLAACRVEIGEAGRAAGGHQQAIVYIEVAEALADYDGHHLVRWPACRRCHPARCLGLHELDDKPTFHAQAIYLDDYPEAYRRMSSAGLIWNNVSVQQLFIFGLSRFHGADCVFSLPFVR